MNDSYYSANLRTLIDNQDPAYIGEDRLMRIISGFSCPKNIEVEKFLQKNSINFTKKNQSVTYLVFSHTASAKSFVGYFTLTIKPISIKASSLSKTMRRKIERVSVLNPANNTYTASAYLIAQLGKNFALSKDERINGADLLELASNRIERTQYDIGGVVEFLECEDNSFLLDFYAKNGFKAFDRRITDGEEPEELIQLLRFI
ncbi:MAG: GNAT family acetyltransferase [Selenomonadaceae bacterium]|nr:GNAT family acetyltransferase [Selenomonadaceae bacterium]